MTRTQVFVLTAVLLLAAGAPLGSTGAAAQADCGFPFTSTDATGTEVTVAEEPERVVTLNPSAAQTMWEIGAEAKVVGLSGFASYLDGADSRTNVYPATSTSVNVEAVVNLTPDLVLAPNTIPDDTVAQLRNAGVTVYKFEAAGSIEDVDEKTRLTGRLVGECEAAANRADRMNEDVETIREATEDVDRPLVLYVLAEGGWTAGEGTFVDTVITTAGGRNLASESGMSGYRQISEEVVLAEDPEWIVLNTDVPAVPDSSAYQQTTAVEQGNVVVVDANHISQPAPRVVDAMETLVRAFHPDAYAAVGQGEEEPEETEEADDDDGPPPSFTITSGSMGAERVEVGEPVSIVVNVTNDGSSGTFVARTYVDDSLKATRDVRIRGGQSETVRLQHTFTQPGQYVVRVNERRMGTVSVSSDSDAGPTTTAETETATADATQAERTNSERTPTTVDDTPEPATSTEGPATTTAPAGDGGATTETAAPTGTGTPVETVEEPAGLPGFGIGVALLAVVLVTAGLLARRRP